MPLDPEYSFAQALDEVILRLGRRNDNDFQGRCVYYLNSAIYRIATSFMDVPDLEDYINIPIAPDVNEYDLRTTAPPINEFVGLKWMKYEKTGYRLRRFPYDEYKNLVHQAHGDPVRWARNGYTLCLDPIPTAPDYDLVVQFRRLPQQGFLELDSKWHENAIKMAVCIGWGAVMEHERSRAVLAELPASFQLLIQQPIDQSQWEAAFDPDLGIRPLSFGY